MQQLLARSRRSATPDAPWIDAAPADDAGGESSDAESRADSSAAHSSPLPLPEPSHRQDKASVRADLDSLRNVANTAARTAIAKYSSRAIREKLLYRSLLTTLSVLITAVLLSSAFWGDGEYMHLGWLAAAASGALGFDLVRAASKQGFGRSKVMQSLKREKANHPATHAPSHAAAAHAAVHSPSAHAAASGALSPAPPVASASASSPAPASAPKKEENEKE